MDLSLICKDNGKTVKLTDTAWDYTKGDFITCNKWMIEQISMLQDVAKTDWRVLICGGQGTQKQRYAEYVHKMSQRANKPYMRFDCKAVHISQYGNELLGNTTWPGVIEQCSGGSLLLDSADSIPACYSSCFELLMENGYIQRCSGEKVDVDVRLLATISTDFYQKDIEHISSARLLQRLGAVRVELLPLNKRKEDIALQSLYHMWQFSSRLGSVKRMGSNLFNAILDYPWPGNDRELESFIEQIVLISLDNIIDDPGLMQSTGRMSATLTKRERALIQGEVENKSLKEMVNEYELTLIRQSIRRHGSLRKAAVALQVTPSALSKKLSAVEQKK